MKKSNVSIHIRIPDVIDRVLEKMILFQGGSKNWHIIKALEKYLESKEVASK